MPVKGSTMNKCLMASQEPYALDAAGQKVYAGDYVVASLPNVPAVRRPRTLYPCKVLHVYSDSFQLAYAGKEQLLLRWTKDPFIRWRREVVKADLSSFGLEADGNGADSCSCCPYRRMQCDGD